MKRILITGANSYIGTSLERWLAQFTDRYSINTIDMRESTWKEEDFSQSDVVFHVAGIVHARETKENQELYYKVNRDLAYEAARKAKAEGVKQFIFLSSMSVYGLENGVINKDTPLKPNSNYGKSKLQAEELIRPLGDRRFKVAIIRPPMVYGEGCKGNYIRLANFSVKAPIFPNIDNKRSMIYIRNFCEFIRLLIDDYGSGLFFPQNEEYVCTSEMVRNIAEVNGKKIVITKVFNRILRLFMIGTVKKVFGDLVYEKYLSEYKSNYFIYNFRSSITLTERSDLNEPRCK